MAVKINQYQQQTVPNSLGVVPRATPLRVSNAGAEALMRVADDVQQAGVALARMKEARDAEAKRKEEEEAKAWTARNLAAFTRETQERTIQFTNEMEPGGAGFVDRFEQDWDEREQTVLSLAPNETARKFIEERLLVLRADYTGRALAVEAQESERFKVNQVEQAANDFSAVVAADPSQYMTKAAEFKALTDAMVVRPETREKFQSLQENIALSYVVGEVKRNPRAAQANLAARLGMQPEQVASAGDTADSTFDRMIMEESNGQHFDKNGRPTTSPVGAIGIAQVMPATGPEAARYANLPWDEERFRNDPEYNKALGRAYYDEMLRRYKDPALAAAAYNAGPGALNGWIKKFGDPTKGEIPLSEFIAKIPYNETRAYVQKVAPASAAGQSIEQAIMANPNGGKTGNPAYDALSVQQVVSLLGTVNSELEKEQALARSFVAAREQDDMAAFGDGKMPEATLTKQEFVAAFGDVEGVRRWDRYSSGMKFAGEVSRFGTMNDSEIAATLQRMQPAPGPGYAAKSQQFAIAQQAAQRVVEARRADPQAYAQQMGLSGAEPLNFSDDAALVAGLRKRAGVADTMESRYGTEYTLLTNGEVQQLTTSMTQMTSVERVAFMKRLAAGSGERGFRSIMGQIRKDSPVTGMAGMMTYVGGTVKVSDEESRSAESIAQTISLGEDLLNPTKQAQQQNGLGRFPMPPEQKMRAVWVDYVGDAYAGSPEQEQAAYQAFKAFYAGERARSGGYDGKLDDDVAMMAARAVTGGVMEIPGSGAKVLPPFGMDPNRVLSTLSAEWNKVMPTLGRGEIPFDAIGLVTTADGVYTVMEGTGPLRDKNGRIVTLRVARNSGYILRPGDEGY
jgi:soluble lytic murein transglycosylase-like protein